MPTEQFYTTTRMPHASVVPQFQPSRLSASPGAKIMPIRMPPVYMVNVADTPASDDIVTNAVLDTSEQEAVASQIGQVSDDAAQACVNMINAFIDSMGTDEGLSGEAYAWIEKLNVLIDTNAPMHQQMVVIYKLAQSQQLMAVASCVLTYLAYIQQVDQADAAAAETGAEEETQVIDGSGLLEQNNQKQAECEASGLVWERAIDSVQNNGTCVAPPSGPPMAPFGLPMTQQAFRYTVAAGAVGLAAWFFLIRK